MNLQMCKGQGFIPIYESTKLTDALHEVADSKRIMNFLPKRKMKEIQKLNTANLEKNHKSLSSISDSEKNYIVKRKDTAEKPR